MVSPRVDRLIWNLAYQNRARIVLSPLEVKVCRKVPYRGVEDLTASDTPRFLTATLDMRSGSKMIGMLYVCLGVAVLMTGLLHGTDNHENQDCRGAANTLSSAQANSPSRTPRGSDLSTASPFKAPSVRLSWNASVPASNSPVDAIEGYNIYRREPGKQYEKINSEVIPGTSCVDHSVRAGQTYHYQAVAVTAQGTLSKPSNLAKATVPSQ